MDTAAVAILVIALVILGAGAWFAWHSYNRKMLKQRFGPEYQRAVRDYGTESKAESALTKRTQRLKNYTIRPLTQREHDEFASGWRNTQARFVDDPRRAVREADTLVCRLMETRGYPMTDFDQRAQDVSVDHPHVVQNYRAAHKIAVADSGEKVSTEDLRRALVHYRALFDELLQTQPASTRHEVHA